jgi:hypothetical protein
VGGDRKLLCTLIILRQPGAVVATTARAVQFALRTSEPDRAACGARLDSPIYVGDANQDEASRRFAGRVATTCVSCRRQMLWDTPTRPVTATRPRHSIGRWPISALDGL